MPTGTYQWHSPTKAVVFSEAGGAIRLVVLRRPTADILEGYETQYPDLPIREGIDAHWPEEENNQ